MIRVPKTPFNGTFISRHFFPDYFKYNNLRTINSGRCYDWAYFGHRLFGADLWATDFHAWCKVGRKYHDSETGKYGVLNFMQLGCNRRNAYPLPWDEYGPQQMTLQEFKDFWDREGGGHRRHWDNMLEPLLQRVLGKRYRDTTPIIQLPIPAMVIP